MRRIEGQTEGRFQTAHFRPPGCENARCSFHATYVVMPDGTLVALNNPSARACCRFPEPAEAGAHRSIAFVARQWAAPAGETLPLPAPGLQGQHTARTDPLELDVFLCAARGRTFSVSAMAFQDAWSLDIERLRDCCIHVFDANYGLVPFCAYNLTAVDGSGLYRR
jgi:hypothetical protein